MAFCLSRLRHRQGLRRAGSPLFEAKKGVNPPSPLFVKGGNNMGDIVNEENNTEGSTKEGNNTGDIVKGGE